MVGGKIKRLNRKHTDSMTHRTFDSCHPPLPSGTYPASHRLDLARIPQQ